MNLNPEPQVQIHAPTFRGRILNALGSPPPGEIREDFPHTWAVILHAKYGEPEDILWLMPSNQGTNVDWLEG